MIICGLSTYTDCVAATNSQVNHTGLAQPINIQFTVKETQSIALVTVIGINTLYPDFETSRGYVTKTKTVTGI